MQVSVESTGKLERKLQVHIPAAQVSREIDDRLKTIGRTARLNGFRPGKAPLNVIRRQFGAQVQREVIGDLLQSSFSQAVTQEQLNPAGTPRIEPQSAGEGQDLRYVAIFEVYPDVQLKPLDELQIEQTIAQVEEHDIDAMIERLRTERPRYSAVERDARQGDRLNIDFDGTIAGEAFAGGKGENVSFVLGQQRMLPEFEQGLLGVHGGDEKTLAVTFPADYRVSELSGKTAEFKIRVKGVEEGSRPDLDDEFFKDLGVQEGGIDRLRADIAENLQRALAQNLRARNRQRLLEHLHNLNPIDVPASLVASQVEEMQVEAMRRAGVKDPAQAPAREQFEPLARRRVALGLVLNEIIKREQIVLDQRRVSERLKEIAQGYAEPEELIKAYRQNSGAMRQVESLVLEDQVVDRVRERAKVTEAKSSFSEVMQLVSPAS